MNAYEWALAFKEDAAKTNTEIKKLTNKNMRNAIFWGSLALLGLIKCGRAIFVYGWNSGTRRDAEVVCESIDEFIDWETM